MAGGWIGAPYLSEKWVADGWLLKQPFVLVPGAWANEGWLSRRWVADTWLYHVLTLSGASITQANVPGLALAALAGSARQATIVNATTPGLALAKFNANANAGHRIAQTNVPGLALATFSATANGSVYQVADVTFAIEVVSTISYVKSVTAQNLPGLALNAIEAIVTTGTDINIAVTIASLPVAIFATSVKADTSTRAVSTIGTPLQALNAAVSVGKRIGTVNTPNLPLAAIAAAVAAATNLPIRVTATRPTLSLVALPGGIGVPVAKIPDEQHILRSMVGSRVVKLPRRSIRAKA